MKDWGILLYLRFSQQNSVWQHLKPLLFIRICDVIVFLFGIFICTGSFLNKNKHEDLYCKIRNPSSDARNNTCKDTFHVAEITVSFCFDHSKT